MSNTEARIEAPRVAMVRDAETFRVGDTITFVARHVEHKHGSSLVIGMSGRVVRVLPAEKLHNPHPGETGRIEVEFYTRTSGAFTEWLWSSEARHIAA